MTTRATTPTPYSTGPDAGPGTSSHGDDGARIWEELVTSALLGTDRRAPTGPARAASTHVPDADKAGRPDGAGPDGAGPDGARPDRAAALLDTAALHTVRRRAGLRPGPAAPPPAPAPEDPRRPLPEAARRRLDQLLAGRAAPSPAGRRGAAPDLTELLPQWLALANERGYKAPPATLPALLDAARARTDLRPLALRLAGPRGLWLAGLNPEWRFALRGAGAGGRLPGLDDTEGVRTLWDEGLFAERIALLAAVRTEDPAAGLALLTSTWSAERAEDRLMFLDSLRTGLSDADEEFLEAALGDRSRNVRATAAELLSALPASALAGRMAGRAATCVGLDRTAESPTISVEAPHECDAAMQRDGLAPTPPTGRGERSWWLGQLVEAAPLSCWQARFGGRAPEEIVALPVADDWQDELHAAWCRAAVRQRDAAWSRALLGAPATPPATGPGTSSLAERAQLLATVPADERARWVADFVAAHGLSEAFQLLGVCAVPWAEPLGAAVIDALDSARDAGSYPWSFSGVMGLAERCLAPEAAARLDPLTALPDEEPDTSPGAGGYWAEAFQRLVSTLRLRAAMRAELVGTDT
ncbi:DUF5691 domain-containing protein [Streptomyces sp. NBC_00094]|uniref:DUF5691 domain-containing protein n=1 Tax=Streptomyces sp. NBC_00094 TaxID=2903620 RepID=UPI0022508970|nr:DUF5691 domain-containing protein [Streptomyces sp. NBC_00094]MCX5392672.1 DUF5691 domain-containing protein [Streptomyces sp. NBC_00094]